MTTPQSPDLDPYAGLTLDPRSAQDFIDEALADAITKMPGYTPRAGNTEVVLIENLALIVAELVHRLNVMPVTITEVLLGTIFGIPLSPGTPAQASVRINMVDTQDRLLAAGTRLGLMVAGQPFTFTTLEDLTVAAGAGFGEVAIQSDDLTDQLNGIPAGTAMQLIDVVAFVESVQLITDVSGGTAPEDESGYLDRASQQLRRLTSTLVTADNFTAATLSVPGVSRATAVDLYNPSSGNQPGQDAGHLSMACLDADGNPLSDTAKASLLSLLQGQAQANLALHIIDPTFNNVDITATVQAAAGSDPTAVHDAVVAALQSYLSPAVWPWSGLVRVNELIALISGVSGVDYLTSMTTPAADLTLSGAAPLAQAGTLRITVNPA